MEQYRIDVNGIKINLPDFPNAEKIIQLDNSYLTQRLTDLTLHRSDLAFAERCLDRINAHAGDETTQEALFIAATVYFYKCFGANEARFPLSVEKIYRKSLGNGAFTSDVLAVEVFGHLKDIRNKHFVHDESPLIEGIPGAVLNKRNTSNKIEKVLCTSRRFIALNKDNYSNLLLLVKNAFQWVSQEFDNVCGQITSELEKKPYNELLAMPEKQFEKEILSVEEVSATRKRYKK